MAENSSVSHIANISTCQSSEHSILVELAFLIAAVILSLILSATGVALNHRHQHHPSSIIHRLCQHRLTRNVEEASAQL